MMGIFGSYNIVVIFVGDVFFFKWLMGWVFNLLWDMGINVIVCYGDCFFVLIKGLDQVLLIIYCVLMLLVQVKLVVLLVGFNVFGIMIVIEFILMWDYMEKMFKGFGVEIFVFVNEDGDWVIKLMG